MDIVDRAQRQTEMNLQYALMAHRNRKVETGLGTSECLDCGDPIPRERRKQVPGCIRCVECQALFERRVA